MENQPLVSVIIPVYNVEEYLRECVDSVLNQTYKHFEIILVDDGSTDSSGKICDEYVENDERISAVHQKNGGLSAARNSGLSEAEGKYVYFLDSDDYITDNALETLVEIAEKDNSDIVFFDAVSFADTDDFEVSQNYIRKNKYNTDLGINIFKLMTQNNEFHSPVYLMLFKKAFIDSNSLLFVPGILHEDMVFTYQALCLAQIVSQSSCTLYYRRYRKNSIMTSSKTKKHFSSCVDVCRINFNFTLEKFGTDIPSEVRKYISRCAFNIFNVYEKLGKADKKICKAELKKAKKDIINNNAFDDKALKMRCYGKSFWFIYKIFSKTVGRLMKGTK
ncbi:MAG: glycosyltransferase [Clostridia bacterium]|nr:glycosyltransferase [Clostridia bacterium]